MRKVLIRYESDPGIKGKSNIRVEGTPLELQIGASMILDYIANNVAAAINENPESVVRVICNAVITEMAKEGKENE